MPDKSLPYAELSYSEGSSLKVPPTAPEWAISASKRIQQKLSETGKISTAKPPPGVSRVLLHSCCAPCSGAMVEEMQASEVEEVVVFFYNPNIHPRKEYEIRKEENKEYCKRIGVEFIDCDYDVKNWYSRMKGKAAHTLVYMHSCHRFHDTLQENVIPFP